MNVAPDCYPCLVRQALQTVRTASPDPSCHARLVQAVCRYLGEADSNQSASHFALPIYALIHAMTGVADPYAELKKGSNALALSMVPMMRQLIDAAPDRLAAALHAAAAGNVIDAGVNHGFDICRDLAAVMELPFGRNDLDAFRSRLHPGVNLLYLLDNAGEVVFDRLCIEQLAGLGATVTAAVKSGPIINDALAADAHAAGLHEVCTVMETGSADVGVNWKHASPALRRAFDAADLVIAKGHGHFETLDDADHPGLFCLLKAKCNVVADRAGVALGDLIFVRIADLHPADRA